MSRSLVDLDVRVDELLSEFPPRADESESVERDIVTRFNIDQLLRNSYGLPSVRGFSPADKQRFDKELTNRIEIVDRENAKRMRVILEEYGWPTIRKFGAGVDNNAWVLIQHADHDIGLQKYALALLEPLVITQDTQPANYAMLYDRIAGNEGRRQRYGTQGRCVGLGLWKEDPLEAPEQISQLRSSMQLEPLEEYKKRFQHICEDALR